ncbi:MAG TPA: hypothetical protein VFT19_01190, partial [Solirubrobacterales bacterium]|nr:hypothetical protein [Solirubrobacterales bacterium]
RAVPMLANSTLALARLAEGQTRKGEYENALKSLEEADGIIEAGGERWPEFAVCGERAGIVV